MKTVSIIIPMYNESEGIHESLSKLETAISALPYAFECVAVNDGSTDDTLQKLQQYSPSKLSLRIVDLSRNFGKEAALTAGMEYARGDAVIPMDADLQDPPELIAALVAEWEKGFEVVLAKRQDRQSDSLLKRTTARWFYRFINRLSEIKIPEDVGDFRLMDRVVVDVIKQLPENHRFMKGLFAWAGFRTTSVEYMRPGRARGETKFNGWKLWNLALEGITSFSTVPLRMWTYMGFLVSTIAFIYGGYIIFDTLFHGNKVPGYPSLLSVILFLSGIQIAGMGILGEYLGRAYLETKRRPVYIARSVSEVLPETKI
jgi:glycosyltransferase involved in cell wall biosynthesis